MAHISRDQRFRGPGYRNLEERNIPLIRELDVERDGGYPNAPGFYGGEYVSDLLRLERELGASEHRAVLRHYSIVNQKGQVSRQEEVYDPPGVPLRVQKAGDEDVGVENDPQAR